MDISHLVKFTSEAFWSWTFLGKFYEFNLFTCYKFIHIFLFTLETVLIVCVFPGMGSFPLEGLNRISELAEERISSLGLYPTNLLITAIHIYLCNTF